jgi:uncharacterized coiled-coil protein SlyX
MQEQQATIVKLESEVAQQQKDFRGAATRQQKQIDALTAGLQKVNAQVVLNKLASQTVMNQSVKGKEEP